MPTASNVALETSSLEAMEALTSGCPVIAYRSGDVIEVAEDSVYGFLIYSVDELAATIRDAGAISISV